MTHDVVIAGWQQRTLDELVQAAWMQTSRLLVALETEDFFMSWWEAGELRRLITRLEVAAAILHDPADRARVASELVTLDTVAPGLLMRAPTLSPDALRQRASCNWWADLSAWQAEEQQWIARRTANDGATASVPRTRATGSPAGRARSPDAEQSRGIYDEHEAERALRLHRALGV